VEREARHLPHYWWQRRSRPRAWSAALEAIDPERQRVKESPWLSLHFHQWVVRAWLDVGNVARARRPFGLIPEHFGLTELKLKELKWRLEDAEEAELLAESVYPVNVDPARRWRQPQGEGRRCHCWASGPGVSADKNGVVVVMAEMREGEASQASRAHEVHRQAVAGAHWCSRSASAWVLRAAGAQHQTASRDDSRCAHASSLVHDGELIELGR